MLPTEEVSQPIIIQVKMSVRSIFNELLLLKDKGGYIAHRYLGRLLSVRERRRIYQRVEADFPIKWDLYHLELTLAVSSYPRISRIFLLILGNYSLSKFILRSRGWMYEAKYPHEASVCEVYFRDNGRSDLSPFLGYSECSIYSRKKSDLINALRHLGFHLTFRGLFASRVGYLASKFRDTRLPETIILQEGRSLEYRSLYVYARPRNINVEFSWKHPNSFIYAPKDLLSQSNLDYPGRLYRKPYQKNKIVQLITVITFNEAVLIVVPTSNSIDEVLEWIRKTVNLVRAPRLFFSIHPTYTHLRPALIKEGHTSIDDSKSEYLQKYGIFIGCYSTLLAQAVDQGKTVMAIGYSQDQLERMDGQLSNFTIHDARAFTGTDGGNEAIRAVGKGSFNEQHT